MDGAFVTTVRDVDMHGGRHRFRMGGDPLDVYFKGMLVANNFRLRRELDAMIGRLQVRLPSPG